MLARDSNTKKFNRALAVINQELMVLGKVNDQSQSVYAEDTFLRLLNKLYGWRLVNANDRNPNAEAVDLIDNIAKICFQVTATCKTNKVNDTLAKKAMKLYAEGGYRIMFLFVGEQKESIKESTAIRNPHGVLFDQSQDLLFTVDLVSQFRSLDVNLQDEILNLVALESRGSVNNLDIADVETKGNQKAFSISCRFYLIFTVLCTVILTSFIYYTAPLNGDSQIGVFSSIINRWRLLENGRLVDDRNPWETFPREWSGSYTGHSSWSTSEDVERHVNIHFNSVNESGALRGTCEVNSEDSGEGHMHSIYSIEGDVNWKTGDIELNGVAFIYQGEFTWMTNFRGKLDDKRLHIIGYSESARPGSNSGNWSMNAINE